MATSAGPLAGTKILELGQMIAVPAATHLLASYGADVIKVEDADRGDDLRFFGSQKGGMSGWFANSNSGKRSIGLDLKSDAGKDVLWRLVEQSDIFIEGFRAGVVDRLGFGFEAVRARSPSIIYCSSSGFGPIGPYAGQPVYDPLIQSLTGWAGVQQHAGQPTLVRGMVADKIGAYTNAQAMMAALVKRTRTGEGSHVQVSMLEANIGFLWPDVMMDCTLLDDDADHRPNVLGIYRLYRCSDGWVAIAPGADRHWQGMCEVLDREDLVDDKRFKTAAARSAVLAEWFAVIDSMVKPFTVAQAVARLRQAEVPVAPVLNPDEVHADPQVQAAGLLEESTHPAMGRFRHPRTASAYFGESLTLSPAPTYGQHTREILEGLGYDAQQTKRLIAQSAVVAGGATERA
ncbi:MAG: CoA transferase [Pseudomonadales bacterium]|jgi:crotonobetainyl-CoA:carnitine CoA-transferase CaiB-like acyl-CoA transferase|nr:CoA transferase [Pseudomonadales bacterium]MDP6829232.1 CoA transferase [Pseudomonadales bacterium]MDP6972629.1 CoA transferase [Pseudomonadales bacterium]|tara:strand:+ start:1065 stop:2273 length:1209 start_codon:yes stop_codon:yes gene_type:complete